MKKLWFILFALIAVTFAIRLFGQTTISGGTTVIEFTPATTTNPCPLVAQKDGTYAVCSQNKVLTLDAGDGLGYVSLKGATGPQGIQGIPGPVGPAGPAGTSTMPSSCDFTITSTTASASGIVGGTLKLSNCK